MIRSGGYRKSKEVGGAKTVALCVNLAAEWFRGRVCLFLIDDVWCHKGLDCTVSDVLSGLSDELKSRMAFTTRDANLRSAVKIRFRRRGVTDSEKMLLHSAGLGAAPEEPDEISAMETVLNMAYGLPIALNVVGTRARYMVEENEIDPSHV